MRSRSRAQGVLACLIVCVCVQTAQAERIRVPLPTPEVVGRLGSRAFLRIELPVTTLTQREVETDDALLLLKTGSLLPPSCIAIIPIDDSEPIPDDAWAPDGPSALFWARPCSVQGTPGGLYVASVRPLIEAIRAGSLEATSLIIGCQAESETCSRLSEEIVSAFEANPTMWSTTLDLHDATIPESE